jgi:pimeloyl-ACP methyl ester carboxylesterase
VSHRILRIPAEGGAMLSATEFAPSSPPDADTPTVVLAHGWTLTRESWEPVVREVQSHRAVRIVTYDQRGHGRSSWGGVRSQSIRALADDLATVLEATAPSGPLVLGGHSMGGMTVLAYAGRHRSAFADRVRGTVLVSTTASVAGRRGIRGEAMAMSLASRVPLLAPRALLPAAVHRRHAFGENPDPAAVKATARQIGRTPFATTGRYFTSISAHDEVESLDSVALAPSRVLVGSRDRITPARWSRALHAGIPGSVLTVLPGKGHMLTYEATDAVADALIEMIDRR